MTESDSAAIARRAPFSDNPSVGQRGQRTQQRILAAALQAFGEAGYHTTSIADIAKRAGCSRVTFYQYFSSKEDVFGHLSGQVVRQVSASIEAMGLLTADAGGWATIREWVERYADIYDRFGAVFHVFETAAEDTEEINSLRRQAAASNVAQIHSKLATTTLGAREVDAVIGLLLDTTARAYYTGAILRAAAPEAYTRARIDDAIADVMHRTLFGAMPAVNVRPAEASAPAPLLDFDRTPRDGELAPPEPTDVARGTYDALLAAGREVFVQRGYHGTRVDDVVARAGLSHGVFYRYFPNKAVFARTLVLGAMEPLSSVLAAVPDSRGEAQWTTAALRGWLRRYNEVHVSESAIIRVWVDATLHEQALGTDAAAALDWGRRQLVHFLRPRGFGDVDAEAVVGLALLDAFGGWRRSAPTLEATVHAIERGLLGR